MGDIARLEKLGLLGPNMLLLHMGWVDAKELHMLQRRDVKISLAPSASMHQAMGNISHGKTPEMLELGLCLSLGSDSAMSSNYLDAIRQAFLIVGGLHEARLDPKVLRPETAVEMLTINGARCMRGTRTSARWRLARRRMSRCWISCGRNGSRCTIRSPTWSIARMADAPTR